MEYGTRALPDVETHCDAHDRVRGVGAEGAGPGSVHWVAQRPLAASAWASLVHCDERLRLASSAPGASFRTSARQLEPLALARSTRSHKEPLTIWGSMLKASSPQRSLFCPDRRQHPAWLANRSWGGHSTGSLRRSTETSSRLASRDTQSTETSSRLASRRHHSCRENKSARRAEIRSIEKPRRSTLRDAVPNGKACRLVVHEIRSTRKTQVLGPSRNRFCPES